VRVTPKHQDDIGQIEATQAALRASIEATKGLAEMAERLLHRNRQKRDREAGEGGGPRGG
jgi:hypothetical protein